MKLLTLTLVCLVLSSCTKDIKPKVTLDSYRLSAKKIKSVTSKLASESDAKRLNTAAVALQQSRLVTCTDVNQECAMYGKLISKMITLTKDNELSAEDKKAITKDYQDLKDALIKSETLLSKKWDEYYQSMNSK